MSFFLFYHVKEVASVIQDLALFRSQQTDDTLHQYSFSRTALTDNQISFTIVKSSIDIHQYVFSSNDLYNDLTCIIPLKVVLILNRKIEISTHAHYHRICTSFTYCNRTSFYRVTEISRYTGNNESEKDRFNKTAPYKPFLKTILQTIGQILGIHDSSETNRCKKHQ